MIYVGKRYNRMTFREKNNKQLVIAQKHVNTY